MKQSFYKGYRVTEDGTVYGKTGSPRKLSKRKDGYLQLTIHETGYYGAAYKRVNFMHHKFVWEAFNGPVEGDLHVDHIDENKSNNKLSNLRLLTPAENIGRRFR